MSYALPGLSTAGFEIAVLDSRGHSKNPALSIFPLMRSLLSLIYMRLRFGLDLVHINMAENGSVLRKSTVLWLSHLLGIPVVLHLHASDFATFFESLPNLGKWAVKKTFSAADQVLVLGGVWRDYVCEELGVPAGSVSILLNAAPGPDAIAPQKGHRELRILFLGRLGRRKGVPELIDALSDPRLANEDWSATLAGDGEVSKYREEVSKRGLAARIDLPGWVSADASHALLEDASVLVLPSHAEGLPISVIEALAFGLPVVTTPVGAIPDVIENGVNGLLVDAGSSAQIADALLALLGAPELRARLAASSRTTWEARLTIDYYVRALASVWQAATIRD